MKFIYYLKWITMDAASYLSLYYALYSLLFGQQDLLPFDYCWTYPPIAIAPCKLLYSLPHPGMATKNGEFNKLFLVNAFFIVYLRIIWRPRRLPPCCVAIFCLRPTAHKRHRSRDLEKSFLPTTTNNLIHWLLRTPAFLSSPCFSLLSY